MLAFILIFKLGDASMGFMVKPFWVDAGFSATEIGLVSVNIGLALSIAGGLAGGWYTDRVGIFKALWVLGLFQALSNLGYAAAAALIPLRRRARIRALGTGPCCTRQAPPNRSPAASAPPPSSRS